jgi:hypothetical protein
MCWIWAMSLRTDGGLDFVFMGEVYVLHIYIGNKKRGENRAMKNFVLRPYDYEKETKISSRRPSRS